MPTQRSNSASSERSDSPSSISTLSSGTTDSSRDSHSSTVNRNYILYWTYLFYRDHRKDSRPGRYEKLLKLLDVLKPDRYEKLLELLNELKNDKLSEKEVQQFKKLSKASPWFGLTQKKKQALDQLTKNSHELLKNCHQVASALTSKEENRFDSLFKNWPNDLTGNVSDHEVTSSTTSTSNSLGGTTHDRSIATEPTMTPSAALKADILHNTKNLIGEVGLQKIEKIRDLFNKNSPDHTDLDIMDNPFDSVTSARQDGRLADKEYHQLFDEIATLFKEELEFILGKTLFVSAEKPPLVTLDDQRSTNPLKVLFADCIMLHQWLQATKQVSDIDETLLPLLHHFIREHNKATVERNHATQIIRYKALSNLMERLAASKESKNLFVNALINRIKAYCLQSKDYYDTRHHLALKIESLSKAFDNLVLFADEMAFSSMKKDEFNTLNSCRAKHITEMTTRYEDANKSKKSTKQLIDDIDNLVTALNSMQSSLEGFFQSIASYQRPLDREGCRNTIQHIELLLENLKKSTTVFSTNSDHQPIPIISETFTWLAAVFQSLKDGCQERHNELQSHQNGDNSYATTLTSSVATFFSGALNSEISTTTQENIPRNYF